MLEERKLSHSHGHLRKTVDTLDVTNDFKRMWVLSSNDQSFYMGYEDMVKFQTGDEF